MTTIQTQQLTDIYNECTQAKPRIHDLLYTNKGFDWNSAKYLLGYAQNLSNYRLTTDINIPSISSLISDLCQDDVTNPTIGQWDSFREKIVPYCKKSDIHRNQGRTNYGEECKHSHWIYSNSNYSNYMTGYLNTLNREHGIHFDLNDNVFYTHMLIQQILILINTNDYITAYGSGPGKYKNEAKEIIRYIIIIIIGIYY
tara:strand:- start:1155 stop:1751 length:597 start_codon:yes stop_codon:yes gene_type:complete